MHASDLRTLVDYSYWARDRVVDAVAALGADDYAKPMGNSFGSIRDTMIHLYSAEWVWIERINGNLPTAFPDASKFLDLAALRTAWAAVEKQYRDLVATLTDDALARVVEFKTLAGAPMSSPLGQIVQHVVNHGTYHRGQVVTMLRQQGAAAPKGTDLIFYYRDHPAQR